MEVVVLREPRDCGVWEHIYREDTGYTPSPGHVCGHSRASGQRRGMTYGFGTLLWLWGAGRTVMALNSGMGMEGTCESYFPEEEEGGFDDRRGGDVNNGGGFMLVWPSK